MWVCTDLQKIRYDNPKAMVINKDITDEKDIFIAPMILTTFIENGFKHCRDKTSDAAINISIKADRRVLEFEMDNSFDLNDEEKKKEGGFGLYGVERRLKLIYKKNYTLNIEKKDYRFYVKLIIRFDPENFV